MRDARAPQRVEDRLAQRRDHDAAIGQGGAEDPEAVAVEPPRLAGDEGECDEREEHPDADGLKRLEPRDGLGGRRGEIGEHRGEVFRLLGPFGDRHAHPSETQEREDRDDDRHRIEDRKEAQIPGPVAKQKMNARERMAPDDHQGERLLGAAHRIGDPYGGHHVGVGGLETHREADPPCPDYVDEDQGDDHQAEADLDRLPRRHPQRAPPEDGKQ